MKELTYQSPWALVFVVFPFSISQPLRTNQCLVMMDDSYWFIMERFITTLSCVRNFRLWGIDSNPVAIRRCCSMPSRNGIQSVSIGSMECGRFLSMIFAEKKSSAHVTGLEKSHYITIAPLTLFY